MVIRGALGPTIQSIGSGCSDRSIPSSPNHEGGDPMNADHFKGKWSQFKGELKKTWGKFTDDDLIQIEGDYEKFKGLAQQRYADRKDEISRWADEWYSLPKPPKEPVGQAGRR